MRASKCQFNPSGTSFPILRAASSSTAWAYSCGATPNFSAYRTIGRGNSNSALHSPDLAPLKFVLMFIRSTFAPGRTAEQPESVHKRKALIPRR